MTDFTCRICRHPDPAVRLTHWRGFASAKMLEEHLKTNLLDHTTKQASVDAHLRDYESFKKRQAEEQERDKFKISNFEIGNSKSLTVLFEEELQRRKSA